jgi:hypothetical protein
MGAGQSKKARVSVDVRVLLVEGNDVDVDVGDIFFNPDGSRAVCAGVGQHLNMRRRPSDMPACDSDAELMKEVLTTKLLIPKTNITVLNSSHDSKYAATVYNVEDSLRLAAKMTGSDGLLLFYFSGHAVSYENGSKVALVAADFVDDKRQLITADTLVNSVSGLKERNSKIVFIFDCCYAAQLTQDLTSILQGSRFEVCAIAACAEIESSICYGTLDASFFTYFMHYFMTQIKQYSEGILPVARIYTHCQLMCNAMANMLLEKDGDRQLANASMHPTVIMTEQHALLPVREETDGRRSPVASPISKTLEQRCQPEMNAKWLKKVKKWLETTSEPNLKKLQKDECDYLMQRKLLETVFCLLSRSLAMLTAADQPELARKPNTFILSYIQIIECINCVESSAIKTPDNKMETLSLRYYMKGVAEYLPVSYKSMGELYELYTAMTNDQNEADSVSCVSEIN